MNIPADLQSARKHVMGFACPTGLSNFAWRSAQQTALQVWHAHLSGRTFRGSINFCPLPFYDMIRDARGELIFTAGRVRRYAAA